MIYWSDLTPIRHISDLQTLQHLEQINACNCNRHLILQEVDPTGPLVLLYNPSVASVHRRLSINTAHCYGCRRDAWCFHLSHLLQLCTDVESEMFTADKHEANNSDKIICYRLTVVDVRHSVYAVFGCLHVSGFENDPSVCFDCMHCCMLCFPFFFFFSAGVCASLAPPLPAATDNQTEPAGKFSINHLQFLLKTKENRRASECLPKGGKGLTRPATSTENWWEAAGLNRTELVEQNQMLC